MHHRLPPATPLADEAYRGGEDAFASLASLHCAGEETAAGAYALDGVEDGHGGVAGEDEVAVHAVGEEGAVGGGGNGLEGR